MSIDLTIAAVYWFKYLLFFIPIAFGGIYLIRKVTSGARIELILPAGILTGVAVDIFLLSSLSFLTPGFGAIWGTEIIFVILSICLFFDKKLKKVSWLTGKEYTVFIISFLGWGLYLLNRAAYTGFGGDTDIYYSIAKTFANGNWPLRSPWQPSFLVNYHYGDSLLLGQLQFFTDASFDFIHRLTAFFLIFSCVQILIWLFKRHQSITSILIYQLVPIVGLVTVGSFMIVWPRLPLSMPQITSIAVLPRWISDLPTGVISYDLWGGPGVVEHFIYFLHHGIGLALFSLVLFLAFNFTANWKNYLFLIPVFSALSLASEAYFIPGFFAFGSVTLYRFWERKQLRKQIVRLLFAAILTAIIIFLQGGTITNGALSGENSVAFFPTKDTFANRWGRVGPVDINKAHLSEISSHLLEVKPQWQPFQWLHLGFIWVLILDLSLTAIVWFKLREKIDISIFFLVSAITAVISYFAIVHKYVPSSNARFLAIGFQLSGILAVLSLIWLVEKFYRKFNILGKILLIFLAFWILTPSILPPLMSITRESERNFIFQPIIFQHFDSAEWLKKNLSAKDRVLDMLTGAYFTDRWGERTDPRAGAQLSIQAGVMTPLFGPEIRDLHFEASPEYFDAFYTLNPSSIKSLGVNYLILDDNLFKKLPELRQRQLSDSRYFSLVYLNQQDMLHERIYKINNFYFVENEDFGGTFAELDKTIPKQAEIFVDDRRDVNSWNHLFKAVTLKLRNRNSYTINSPVTYMQSDVYYRIGFADKAPKYNYLILYKDTKPEAICNCQRELIWQGLNNQINLWKVQ